MLRCDRRIERLAWIVGLVVALNMVSDTVWAWEIETGFSDACHESMSGEVAAHTIVGAEAFGETEAGLAVDQKVPLPDSDKWNKLSDLLLEGVDVEVDSRREKFVLTSLVLGSRYPDSGGTAVVNLSSSRELHVYSADQQKHCLRREQDDGPKGNASALEATREHITELVERARRAGRRPPDEQLIVRETFVELYGAVDIEVWAPAFWAGSALHTFQDCFSHTIRTEDLERVLHVLNYTEAITEQHEPARDGLAHSTAMDACKGDAEQIAEVTRLATAQFLAAFVDEVYERDPDAMQAVLRDWTTYQPGCTVENDICESKWLDIAQKGKAAPLVNTPSCSTSGGRGHRWGVWMAILLLVAYARSSLTNSRNK
jgi:hypothetical protein